MPGAFKLAYLQPFKPIMLWRISNFFTFILQVHFLIQNKSVTVTPLTVTVGYSDSFYVSQTITNDFHAVIVTNMRL